MAPSCPRLSVICPGPLLLLGLGVACTPAAAPKGGGPVDTAPPAAVDSGGTGGDDGTDGDGGTTGDGGAGGEGGGTVPATLAAGTVRHCAAPTDREADGPFVHVDDALDAALLPEAPDRPVSAGLSAADLDGDGHLDLLLTQHDGVDLFWGDGTGALVHDNSGRPAPREAWSNHAASVVADFDEDGDLDVIIANRSAPDELWWNDGHGVFIRDDSAPFASEDRATVGASLADVDGDGHLDLFLAGHAEGAVREGPADPSALYLWTPAGFVAQPDALPADTAAGFTFNGTWLDADGDGDLDLYMVNDHGSVAIPSRLLRNDSRPGAAAFTALPGAGLDATMLAMGVALTDLNGDTWPELVVTNFGQLALFESLGDGSWFESSRARGLVQAPDTQVVGWSVVAEDFDNDGDTDIWTTFGSLPAEATSMENPFAQPDALWLWDADGDAFADAAPAWGLDDEAVGRGGLAVDLNEDGHLDLVTAPLVSLPRLHLSRCSDRSWLALDLAQPGANPDAVGARVDIEAAGRVHRRWVVAGGTQIFGTPPSEVHVGLGAATVVDRIRVTWPDGETSVVEDVAVNQRALLQRTR